MDISLKSVSASRFHKRNIKNNIKEEHKRRKKQSKSIECHLCKTSFTDRVEYKNHLKVHSKARRYECSICKKMIIGRIIYMKHLSDAHSDENGSVLRACKYCSKEFKKPSDLVSLLAFFNNNPTGLDFILYFC